jgi:hypothetical protein
MQIQERTTLNALTPVESLGASQEPGVECQVTTCFDSRLPTPDYRLNYILATHKAYPAAQDREGFLQ